mgnify:CR=1 FL=1
MVQLQVLSSKGTPGTITISYGFLIESSSMPRHAFLENVHDWKSNGTIITIASLTEPVDPMNQFF